MPTKPELQRRVQELEQQLEAARLRGHPVPGTLNYAFGTTCGWVNITPYGASADFGIGHLYLMRGGSMTALASVAEGDSLVIVRGTRDLEPVPDEIAGDVAAKHPGHRILGLRPGDYVDLTAQDPDSVFVAAPSLGGWIEMKPEVTA